MVRIAILAFGLVASAAHASPATGDVIFLSGTSGSKLMEICQGWQPGRYDPCGSYLYGLSDGLSYAQAYCAPQGATSRQLAQIIFDYVKSNPNEWHLQSTFLAATALSKAFPCIKR